MKIATGLVLLWGLLVMQCVYAANARITLPRWVIVVTVTDLSTGKQLGQSELGAEVEFDDPGECKAAVAAAPPIPPRNNVAAALTCRKVVPAQADL